MLLWDERHCQHIDNLEVWHNHSLECNSDSRNCPEFTLMVCGVIKALSGGGRLGLQNEEETNSQGKFHNGEWHLKEREK